MDAGYPLPPQCRFANVAWGASETGNFRGPFQRRRVGLKIQPDLDPSLNKLDPEIGHNRMPSESILPRKKPRSEKSQARAWRQIRGEVLQLRSNNDGTRRHTTRFERLSHSERRILYSVRQSGASASENRPFKIERMTRSTMKAHLAWKPRLGNGASSNLNESLQPSPELHAKTTKNLSTQTLRNARQPGRQARVARERRPPPSGLMESTEFFRPARSHHESGKDVDCLRWNAPHDAYWTASASPTAEPPVSHLHSFSLHRCLRFSSSPNARGTLTASRVITFSNLMRIILVYIDFPI